MIFIGIDAFGIDLGVLLLGVALIAFIIDALMVIFGEAIERWEDYSEYSLIIGSSTLIIAFFYFSYSIVTADYNYTNVSSYVSNDMDFFLRLSSIWSSPAGSFFFWAFLTVILYLVLRNLFRDYSDVPIFYRSFILMVLQVAAMILLTILNEPFKVNATPPVNGLGLNPLLMNIWNVVHPPAIFIGYALCLIPMVIAIARISVLQDGKVPDFEGKELLDNFFEFMISIAWLGLSFGIILGSYWAYITLGWGGFWAWDPVETGSLIPWLFLTLYYHGKSFLRKRQFLGNYLVSMSYISALFVTYVTRSNLVLSVHTFRPEATFDSFLGLFLPDNSFLMQMILRIIPTERILVLFLLLTASFLLPHFYGIFSKEILKIPFTFSSKDFQASKSTSTSLKISFIAGLICTYAIILGLIWPVIVDEIGYLVTFSAAGFGSGFNMDQTYYNTIITIFGGIMLLAQFFCTFYPKLTYRRKLQLLIAGTLSGLIFFISGMLYRDGILTNILGETNPILNLLSDFWTTSDKANFVLPLLIFGIVGLIIEFIRVSMTEEKHLIRKTSQTMLHLSFLVILLGALMSSNMTITRNIIFEKGQEQVVPNTSIKISVIDLDLIWPETGIYAAIYETKFVVSTTSGNVIGFGISHLTYDDQDRVGHEVTILGNFVSDIYIVSASIITDIFGEFIAVNLQIKIIPYINVLCAACLFLLFAITPLSIGRFIVLKKSFEIKEENEDEEQRSLQEEIVSNGGKKNGSN